MESVSKGNQSVEYTYDDYGNIEDIYRVNSNNTETLLCSYVYDSYNQLTTVNDYEHSEQTTYTYNQAGNITRRNRYQMNASWVTTATLENVRYVYGDSEWKDLLTTYNGQTITYDAIGNPLSYRDGISLTWQKGRQLASYSDSSNNITYTYDASGMRTGKAVTTSSGATTNYSYVYENGMLQKMTKGSRILEFSYDASGTPVSIKYRSSATATPTYYYYGTNSRGDVVSLYNSDGSVAAIYTYDAYGKPLSVKTSAGIDITSETAIANLNPLRYRGYVYDNETGFYYLQTRYYDPTTCRFVNADGYVSTGQGVLGNNMFAYCKNNPKMYSDTTGEMCIREAGGDLYGYCGSYSSSASAVTSTLVTTVIVVGGATVAYNDLRREKFLIKALERTSILTNTTVSRKSKDPTHHIVAKADYRATESRQILMDVGINPYNDPRNLVVLPKEYHTSLHTTAYHNYVVERLRPFAGNKAGVEATLESLKSEILFRSTIGIRWD